MLFCKENFRYLNGVVVFDIVGDATASLTEVLEPEENLEETLVFNLCTLYELQSSSSVDKKKALVPRVVNSASDAFDLKSLKLGAIAS